MLNFAGCARIPSNGWSCERPAPSLNYLDINSPAAPKGQRKWKTLLIFVEIHESPDLMGKNCGCLSLGSQRHTVAVVQRSVLPLFLTSHWPMSRASVFSCVGPSPCFAGFLGMALSNWTVNMVKFGVPCLRTNPDLSLGLVYLVHLGIPRRKKTMTVNYYKLFLYRSKMADGTMAEKWGMNNELQ